MCEGAIDAQPTQIILADYLAAYAGAASISAVLRRRSRQRATYPMSLPRGDVDEDLGLLDRSALAG